MMTIALEREPAELPLAAFVAMITFRCYGPMRRGTQDRWGN